MRSIHILGVSAMAFGLSACATIVTSGAEDIQVSTPSTEQANCTLTNAEGSWMVASPGTVKVQRSKTPLQVACTKTGFQNAQASGASGFEYISLGNLILGGLLGFGVDWASGAIHKYPAAISVPMRPTTGASTTPQGRPIRGLI
jgi:hypothetical protein